MSDPNLCTCGHACDGCPICCFDFDDGQPALEVTETTHYEAQRQGARRLVHLAVGDDERSVRNWVEQSHALGPFRVVRVHTVTTITVLQGSETE